MLEPRRAWVDDRRADLLQGRRDVLGGLAVMSDELIRMKWVVGILSTIMHDGSGVGSELLVLHLRAGGYGVEYAGGCA